MLLYWWNLLKSQVSSGNLPSAIDPTHTNLPPRRGKLKPTIKHKMKAKFVVQSEQLSPSKKDPTKTYQRLTLVELGTGACRQLFECMQAYSNGEKPKGTFEGKQVEVTIVGIRQPTFPDGRVNPARCMELVGTFLAVA